MGDAVVPPRCAQPLEEGVADDVVVVELQDPLAAHERIQELEVRLERFGVLGAHDPVGHGIERRQLARWDSGVDRHDDLVGEGSHPGQRHRGHRGGPIRDADDGEPGQIRHSAQATGPRPDIAAGGGAP